MRLLCVRARRPLLFRKSFKNRTNAVNLSLDFAIPKQQTDPPVVESDLHSPLRVFDDKMVVLNWLTGLRISVLSSGLKKMILHDGRNDFARNLGSRENDLVKAFKLFNTLYHSMLIRHS